MKKLFITAMMVAVASSSFAQDITKQMKGKSYDEALSILNGALPTLSAEQKAKAYNALTELTVGEAQKTFLAFQSGQTAGANFDAVYNAIDNAVKADPFDNEPNDKGKLAPKFHKKNQDRLKDLRVLLIVHGQDLMNVNQDDPNALKFLEGYVTSAHSSLFAEIAGAKDPNAGNVARVVAFLYAQKEEMEKAKKFAEIAMADTASRADAENIYVAILDKMMKTHEDTLNYINKLKELNPDKYFARMVSLYDHVGEKALAAKLLDEEIARNPQNKMAYAIKGESAMNAREWEKAIEAFKKTVEIDPSFTAVWFNLGVCSYSYASDLNEQLSDKQGKITAENNKKVMERIQDAKTYYEKVRELDPNHEEIVNWPYQLRMVYNQLGETEKANEISKMLGEE